MKNNDNNMQKHFTIIILSLFFKVVTCTHSQAQLSLAECVHYAMEHNINLDNNRITTELSNEDYKQAKRDLLPDIAFNNTLFYQNGKGQDPETNAYVNSEYYQLYPSLDAGMTLFEGFSRLNTISYHKLKREENLASEEKAQNDLAFEVMAVFYDIIYYKGLCEIAKENKELSEKNVHSVKVQIQQGLKSKADLMEIEARLAEEELNLIKTQNDYKLKLYELEHLLNWEKNQDIEVVDTTTVELLAILELDLDSLYSKALGHLPDIKIQKLNLEASKKQLAIERGGLYPRFNVYGSYASDYSNSASDDWNTQLDNNLAKNIRLTLEVPIFNRWKTRSKIAKAKLALQESKNELEQNKHDLKSEIEKDYHRLLSYKAEYKLSRKQEEASHLAFKAAKRKEEYGKISVLEYYTNKYQLARAKGEVLRTALQYKLKLKTIRFYMGEKVVGM